MRVSVAVEHIQIFRTAKSFRLGNGRIVLEFWLVHAAMLASHATMDSLNLSLFRLLNDAHNSTLDIVFGILSGLGDGLVIALICGVIMFYRFRLGMSALVAFILSGLLAQILKRLFDTPRPPAILDQVYVLGSALHSHSFPSGHATSDGVLVVAAFLIWQYKNWQAWLMASLFVIAALGRIYGGVHFPLDVVVGLMIGGLCMWGCWQWSARWPVEQWQASPWCARITGMIVAIEAAVLGLGYHIQPSTAQPLTMLLPVIALLLLAQYWKQGMLAK